MALRKLAGPFDIVDQNGDSPSVYGPVCYVPYMGIVLGVTGAGWVSGGSNQGLLALDGVVSEFTNLGGDHNYGWDLQNRAVLTILDSAPGNEYIRDPRSFLGFQVDSALLGVPNGYAKLPDRRLKLDGGSVYAVIAGVTTLEKSGTGIQAAGAGFIGPGRTDREILLSQSYLSAGNLLCRFYDTTLKDVSSPVLFLPMTSGATCFVFCAAELGVLLALDVTNKQLSVWSFEVLPAAVSDPEVWQGAARKGDVATMRVTVLGDDGEPCAGELVDWSVSGPGTLLDLQSEVDAQGYAVARVFYPLDATGDSTVTASVAC